MFWNTNEYVWCHHERFSTRKQIFLEIFSKLSKLISQVFMFINLQNTNINDS